MGFFDIDKEGGETLEKTLQSDGVNVRFGQCDLRDIEGLKQSVKEMEAALGKATVLVNNAARDDRHSWEDVTEAYYDERIATNLRHLFFMTQAVAPGMIKKGKVQ